MDRHQRLTTFSVHPNPSPSDPVDPGFSTDVNQTFKSQEFKSQNAPRYAKMALKATGASLRLVEALMRSTIRVEGTHNVTSGPTLFVSNHFTRFETFVLPYIIDGHLHRQVHSLAFHKLFRGRFGDFLMSLGARPTGNPLVKHTIVEDLMTGRHDWLIYPEGSMVKNKKTWSNGHYQIDVPDRSGMPHTGAAIMALKALMYKNLYHQACMRHDVELMRRYEDRYHLSGPHDIDVPDLQVIPINITYYPIRPNRHLIYRLAQWMFRQMPSVLEEELLMEGSLLFSETDISVYFGKPLRMDQYLPLIMPTLQTERPFVDQLRSANTIMGTLKNRLTRRMVHKIYTRLTINFDHLFCGGLRELSTNTIGVNDFHGALYLAARGIQSEGKRRCHESIGPKLFDLIGGIPYKPLASIQELAASENIAKVVDNEYVINRETLVNQHSFHDIRIKNTVAVIANEIEPMRKAIRLLRNALKMPATVRRRNLSALLVREDAQLYSEERQASADSPHLKPEHIGKPTLLHRPHQRIGIVLCHGYLAAPAEVMMLAEFLHRLGYAVYVPRLRGHGTSPEQLAHVTADDWVRDYVRAVAIMRNTCDQVVVGGFSAGGLLALEAASIQTDVLGCFAISPCLQLMDPSAKLVPMVSRWNQVMEALHVPSVAYRRLINHPENPTINYPLHYLSNVHQLELLIQRVRGHLHNVKTPTLLIHGDQDPVIHAASSQEVLHAIRSDDKESVLMNFNRHVIVMGEGSGLVFERIADFIQRLVHKSKPPLRRSSGQFKDVRV